MPYIITTTTPDPCNAKDYGRYGDPVPNAPTLMGAVRGCWPPKITRTAVATLEEMRQKAFGAIDRASKMDRDMNSDEQRADRGFRLQVRFDLDAGGTIGPLPDGTVVDVAPIGWMDFERMAVDREDAADVDIATFDSDEYRDAMIRAFNAS